MSKTIKRCYLKCLTYEKLLEAHKRASMGKKKKKEVILFEMDLETNIVKILNNLKNESYKFGEYREFLVKDPKERIIRSLPYPDRVVHQWYVEEFIKPYFYKRFINDTYACLDNRGTHKAVLKVKKYMKKMNKDGLYYVIKFDIKKFFYSIDKGILLSILEDRIRDKKIISLTKIILDDGNLKGIPIGNYTSQYFANIYLDKLDHYIKENLKIKYYVRYMDDFIILIRTKDEAKLIYSLVNEFIEKNLNLSLNKKSMYYPSTHGVDFCGYKIFENYILIRKRFKRKMNKKIKLWEYLYNTNKLDRDKMLFSYNSALGHLKHANYHNYMTKFINKNIYFLNILKDKDNRINIDI